MTTTAPRATTTTTQTPRELVGEHPEDRVTTLLRSPRAAFAFGVIVFAATAIQVLASPIAYLLDEAAPWTLPLSVRMVVALVSFGAAAQAASLAYSAYRPALALIGTIACYLLLVVIVGVPTWLSGMQLVVAIALFLLATQKPPRSSLGWLAIAIAITGSVLTAWAVSTGSGPGRVIGFLTGEGLKFAAPCIGAVALGIWWRARTRRVSRMREHAEAATREHAERLEEARNAERARIAQELHDVAGQHLSGLIALADAAAVIGPRRLDEVMALVDDVRAEGRFAAASVYSALADLRAVGGVPNGATLDLRRIDDVVDYWRRRDTQIELSIVGNLGELPAVVSTSVFRGVQESLTNASKHAPGAPVDLDIVWDGRWLQVVVENGPSLVANATSESVGLGWGLDGLRDRVTMMNGTVSAGPTEEGGWRVRVRIPVLDHAEQASG